MRFALRTPSAGRSSSRRLTAKFAKVSATEPTSDVARLASTGSAFCCDGYIAAAVTDTTDTVVVANCRKNW